VQLRSSGSRFAGLDHLRALAIIIVFVYHYRNYGNPPGLHEWLGSWGWTGVDLFFVLSGYLIGGQLFARIAKDQPISYGEFYFKRSLRILPAYLFVLAIYFIFPGFRERSELPPLWRFLTFTQNFGLDLVEHGAFSHAWSLCIEEQFYLILPLFIIGLTALRSHKKAVWLLPVLFVFGFAIRTFNWYHYLLPHLQAGDGLFGRAYYRLIYYPTYARLDGLLAGVGLAAFYYFQPVRWQKLTSRGNLVFGIAVLLIAAAWLVAHDDNQYTVYGAIFGYPLIAIAYGALALAALSPSCFLYRWSSSFTRLIATLSYSIYLTHKQLIHLTHLFLSKHGFTDDSYATFWISVAIAFLGGWALHLAIEKPFLRLRDKFLARRRAAAQTSAPAVSSMPATPPRPQ
jgi:peptidoglycan/LPS O-acetylase OafA/YrhL